MWSVSAALNSDWLRIFILAARQTLSRNIFPFEDIMARVSIASCVLIFLVICTGCTEFIPREESASLSELERGVYTLKADLINNGDVVLAKGARVRLYVSAESTWIKVYASYADQPRVNAQKKLLLYMFDEDFDGKVLDRKKFDERLDSLVLRVKDAVIDETK